MGPRTLSWGTPEVTLMEEDILPSRRTCFVRLDKNECIIIGNDGRTRKKGS